MYPHRSCAKKEETPLALAAEEEETMALAKPEKTVKDKYLLFWFLYKGCRLWMDCYLHNLFWALLMDSGHSLERNIFDSPEPLP